MRSKPIFWSDWEHFWMSGRIICSQSLTTGVRSAISDLWKCPCIFSYKMKNKFQTKYCFLTYPNCEVVYDWNPHIRVGFEAEREDRGTDEEDRHDPNCLRDKYWGLIEV